MNNFFQRQDSSDLQDTEPAPSVSATESATGETAIRSVIQAAATATCQSHLAADAQVKRFLINLAPLVAPVVAIALEVDSQSASSGSAPRILSPVLDAIPRELRTMARWMVWKFESRVVGGKATKVPYCPTLINKRGSSTDPSTWGSFAQAEAAYDEGGYDGVGFVLNGDGLVGVDIDGCVQDGIIKAEATMLMDSLGVEYYELSPSGKGLRGFGYAENLETGAKGVYNGLNVELYSWGRFMTVTGRPVENGHLAHLSDFSNLANRIRTDKKVNPQTGELERVPAAIRQGELISRIMSGDVYHDSLRDLAASWISTGMFPGGAVNALYALMNAAPVPHDSRWAERYAEIPSLVSSAVAKYAHLEANVSNLMSKAPPIEVPDAPEPQTKKHYDVPPHLLTIPGKLGLMVDWTNATAMKPQPVFAVQAALALGSVAMGRKFRTTNDNWPPLFLLNIGVSGAGKEHAKTVVERVLRAAKFSTLSAASEYTSDSAIDSMLRLHPTHIAIIDEFGYMLKTANAKNNTNGGTARKRLMEVFGRCAGTLQPKAFSTVALNRAQREGMEPRHVENPSLTVLGMTTPTPFYEAVGSGALTDGFLNRLIIVESDLGRQLGRLVAQIEVPEDLVRWVRECRVNGSGDLAEVIDTAHTEVPIPTILDFSHEARQLFDHLEVRCIARMDELEMHGMAEMYSRVREIAMRVSLIVAHSDESFVISAEHAKWAIDYVTHWADRAISRLADNIADTPFAALCNEVANLIMQAGRRGLTIAELARKSAKFKAAEGRTRRGVFENLESDRDIRRHDTKSASGKGKTRAAYIAPEFIENADQKQQ